MGASPLAILAAAPQAPERAKASLRDLRRGCGVPGGTYERVADALTEWGNPRSAWEVVGWMFQDRGVLARLQVCRWVFEGLLWGGHLDQAEEVVATMRWHGRPAWRAMAQRLAKSLHTAGYSDRERGLWRRLETCSAASDGARATLRS